VVAVFSVGAGHDHDRAERWRPIRAPSPAHSPRRSLSAARTFQHRRPSRRGSSGGRTVHGQRRCKQVARSAEQRQRQLRAYLRQCRPYAVTATYGGDVIYAASAPRSTNISAVVAPSPGVPAPFAQPLGAAHLARGFCGVALYRQRSTPDRKIRAMYPIRQTRRTLPSLYCPCDWHTGGNIFSGDRRWCAPDRLDSNADLSQPHII